ncbi:hypothetical protein AB0N38_10455 [Micromonospora aurantiaca]|uniref:hypothetical protein n=1 Tax=Micromonospora aurantiaca (nom. illeg.) TaxID=47850 RepID=UPI0034199B50
MRLLVLRLEHAGRPVLLRVDHAALMVGDTVEVAGQQLARDGTPLGRMWMTVDVRKLSDAVVGAVETQPPRNQRRYVEASTD